MSVEESAKIPDGRRLRSERSKQAIIDASLELMEEGVLVPTAQLISERAGVGIRSFFRHFEDMETYLPRLTSKPGKRPKPCLSVAIATAPPRKGYCTR